MKFPRFKKKNVNNKENHIKKVKIKILKKYYIINDFGTKNGPYYDIYYVDEETYYKRVRGFKIIDLDGIFNGKVSDTKTYYALTDNNGASYKILELVIDNS